MQPASPPSPALAFAADTAATVPERTEVLVIGAGPAGSACALWLARAGRDVLLVDQHPFPRDKVCGDGLIADSHAALQRLGVWPEVAAAAHSVEQMRLTAPRAGSVEIPGRLAVLPRRVLDDLLARAAERAGARRLPPLRFVAPLLDAAPAGDGRDGDGGGTGRAGGPPAADGPRVVGAQLLDAARGVRHAVRARWVVLATGASVPALAAAGLAPRRSPTGTALRTYVHHAGLAAAGAPMEVVWHPRLRGGYGWVFPGPHGVFNVGTGLTGSRRRDAARRADTNLHRMLQAFAEVHPTAGELLRHGRRLGTAKGAPLRCSLTGAQRSRPGLLATGEAIGSTYAFSGEGIGKALETGILAAEAVAQGCGNGALADAQVQRLYDDALSRLQPRFALYERAEPVNRHPWLADGVIWRARRSPRLRARLAGVLEETHDPGQLFTLRGVRKLLFE